MKHDLEETLEYCLTKSILKHKSPDLRGFWCDGITLEDPTPIKNDAILFKGVAFLGSDGQRKFSLSVKLGPEATANYLEGGCKTMVLDLENSTDWYQIHLGDGKVKMDIK